MHNQSTDRAIIQDYTIGGKLTDAGDPFARMREERGLRRYFVSYLTHGVENGRMRNHLSPNQDAMNNPENNRTGTRLYDLREVSQEAFDFYLKYLTTEQTQYLRSAESTAR